MRGAREAPVPRDSLNFRRASLLSRNEFESGTLTIVFHATSSFTYVSVIYGADFPFKVLLVSWLQRRNRKVVTASGVEQEPSVAGQLNSKIS